MDLTWFWMILAQTTVEPALFFKTLGMNIEHGAPITNDLIIDKMCQVELNYSEEICANLTKEGFENINIEVQQNVNNFWMILEWMGNISAFVYSLFAGSLLDQFGCKPFLLVPAIGLVMSRVCLLLNFALIDILPIEFFYMINMYNFFGGNSVFYLGSYSYGALNFKPEDRSKALARYDGLESAGEVLGNILAPIILVNIGIYGNYGIASGCSILTLLYILIFIPHKPSTRNSTRNFFMEFMISPIIDMFKTLFKRRPQGLHWLIGIQIYAFGSYWFTLQEHSVRYLFMLKTFEGFDRVSMSWFNIYNTFANLVGLLVIFPIMNDYFHIHDAAMLTIFVSCEALSKKAFILSLQI